MKRFPAIESVLKTIFNAEDGLSEDVAIRLYQRTAKSSYSNLKAELEEAFASDAVCWRDMLLTEEYEVFDADSEQEAKAYARKILWDPLFLRAPEQ
ncbi:MAG: hypothetical protein KDF48_11205 [Rhodocyclaceae bacterium]|nr:hypothetical protein [Rhodocyclaceae bacterium]